MSDEWGVGDQKDSKAFTTALIGEGEHQRKVELIHGEHPHSRSDNSIYARTEEGSIYGFSGHRPCVRVELQEYNYLKCSHYSGDEVRGMARARIFYDDVLIYSLRLRKVEYLLMKLPWVLVELAEHSIVWSDAGYRERLIGRKVWYRDEPAVVTGWDPEEGTVTLRPDGIPGFKLPGYAHGPDAEWAAPDSQYVRYDILSDHINWHRDP